MAKKKSYKGKKQYAAYANEGRSQKNKARKLAKHLKKHPNDAQSAKMAGKTLSMRKAPMGGQAPEAKTYIYDASGKKELMPGFKPKWQES